MKKEGGKMTIFWITLAAAYILAVIARMWATETNIQGNLLVAERPNAVLAFMVTLTLALVSGLRNNIGDTGYYAHAYTLHTGEFGGFTLTGESGFEILQVLLLKISTDPQILIFFCAIVTNVLIMIIVYKYSPLYELSVFFYIASGMYIVTMNGMRQYLAAAIIFAATPFLLKKDWKKYFLVVIFASLFHQSALILIPAYFFAHGKAWRTRTFILLGAGVIFMVFYNQLFPMMFNMLEITKYDVYENFNEGGANFLRVLVTFVPLLVAYLGRERLEELTPYSDVLVNMSVLGLFFMIISLHTWIYARVAIYFNLYQVILIGWIISLFTERDRKAVYYLIIVLFLIFFIYDHVFTMGIQYESNFLTSFR